MRYKLRGEVNQHSFLEDILKNRGIENIELYKNPVFDLPKAEDIMNLPEMIVKLQKSFNKKILLCVDADTDGYTSASIIYTFLKNIVKDIDLDYYVHPIKTHGITDDLKAKVITGGYEVLIVPDAGSNDVDNSLFLWENGVDILIIDHHEIEVKNNYALVVNNMQDNTNKAFTGAGMTYIVCKELAKALNLEEPKYLLDLAAIGNIADSAVLVSNELRSLCKEGLSNINNNFIKTIMKDKGLEKLSIGDISWKIAPIINGVCRSGSLEERDLLFRALNDIHNGETYTVIKRKLNKEIRKYEQVPFELNFYEYALDILSKCREKQNKLLEPVIKELDSKINHNRQIQIFIIDKEDLKSNTGLVANKMADRCVQPVLVLWEKEDTFTGSARGNTNIMKDFKKYCSESGLFTLCQGHDNAFGVIIKKENLLKFTEKINSEKFEQKQDMEEHLVDCIYEKGDINRIHMKEIANNSELWCNGCPEPQFAVLGIPVLKENVNLYKGGTLKIYAGGITYMKFFAKTAEREKFEIGFGNELIMNAICKFENNTYNGKTTQQAILVDYEIIEKPIEIDNEQQAILDFFS